MFTKCSCASCSGHIEFEATQTGQTVTCPHCGLETVLYAAQQSPPSAPEPKPALPVVAGSTPAIPFRVKKPNVALSWLLAGFFFLTTLVFGSATLVLLWAAKGPSYTYSQTAPPMNPRNRIVEGKVYDPATAAGWREVADLSVPRVSGVFRYVFLEVDSVGPTGVICSVRENESGLPLLSGVKNEGALMKQIVIFHPPGHSTLTTGQPLGPCIGMRVANWRRSNGVVLEAYDCGLPDTAENRKKAGIPIPTNEKAPAGKTTQPANN